VRLRKKKTALCITVVAILTLIDVITGLFIIPKPYNVFRCPHYYYHHDLLPNRADPSGWFDREYMVYTNSLGFRDKAIRQVSPAPSKKRIVLLGDSFVEGLGVSFEESFAGLVSKELDAEILDAGVVGYSPKLYNLKIKHLVEKTGLIFNELIVFIDTSDILNELEYEDYSPQKEDPDKRWTYGIHKLMRGYSATYYLVSTLLSSKEDRERFKSISNIPGWGGAHPELYDSLLEEAWTVDKEAYDKFGRRGLALAEKNMQSLSDFCRKNNISLTIAVYPRPTQIYFYDIDSIQVRFWRDFSIRNGVRFIDLFPVFIDKQHFSGFDEIYDKYFIQGDAHWTPAGHRLIADTLLPILKGDTRQNER